MTSAIDHDSIFKELLSEFFLDFLKLFVPQVLEYSEPELLTLENTETVRDLFTPLTKGKKKHVDLVARLKFQGQDSYFLIHTESQSSAYGSEDFRSRMFNYFARLHEKYNVPVYPIALLTFDSPQKEQDNSYKISFPDRQVLEFSFISIQLNRLNWRNFINSENPIACALMAKMNIAKEDRVRVKIECLRLLASLKLEPKKMELISGFVGTYLQLNEEEIREYQGQLESLDLQEKEQIEMFQTDWQIKGREEGLQQGIQQGLQQGIQQGAEESRREDIKDALELRFSELPDELEETLSQIDDLELLRTLLREAITTPSVEDFQHFMASSLPQQN